MYIYLFIAFRASEAMEVRFEVISLHYHGIHVHIVSNSRFSVLRGLGSLQMASVFTFKLRFEISNFNYPGNNVHIYCNCHFSGP